MNKKKIGVIVGFLMAFIVTVIGATVTMDSDGSISADGLWNISDLDKVNAKEGNFTQVALEDSYIRKYDNWGGGMSIGYNYYYDGTAFVQGAGLEGSHIDLNNDSLTLSQNAVNILKVDDSEINAFKDLAMNNNDITGVDSGSEFVLDSGDTMTGDLNMSNNNIYSTNLLYLGDVARIQKSGNDLYFTDESGNQMLFSGDNLQGLGQIDTGNGLTEVYAMNQDVQTSDDVIFADLSSTGILNIGATSELTINDGNITITKSFHRVDTESDAGTDDLNCVFGGSEGDIVYFRGENSGRDVTYKHVAGCTPYTGTLDFTDNSDCVVTNGNQLIRCLHIGASGWMCECVG